MSLKDNKLFVKQKLYDCMTGLKFKHFVNFGGEMPTNIRHSLTLDAINPCRHLRVLVFPKMSEGRANKHIISVLFGSKKTCYICFVRIFNRTSCGIKFVDEIVLELILIQTTNVGPITVTRQQNAKPEARSKPLGVALITKKAAGLRSMRNFRVQFKIRVLPLHLPALEEQDYHANDGK